MIHAHSHRSYLAGLTDITLDIQGELRLSDTFTAWNESDSGGKVGSLDFFNCSGLTITSTTESGLIDGQGLKWWWAVRLNVDIRVLIFVRSLRGKVFRDQG